MDLVTGDRSLTEVEDFSSTLCIQPAMGPTQLSVQWVPGIFPRGKCGRDVLLTINPLLLPWVERDGLYLLSTSVSEVVCYR
jgi:hypothetical protein